MVIRLIPLMVKSTTWCFLPRFSQQQQWKVSEHTKTSIHKKAYGDGTTRSSEQNDEYSEDNPLSLISMTKSRKHRKLIIT